MFAVDRYIVTDKIITAKVEKKKKNSYLLGLICKVIIKFSTPHCPKEENTL